MRVLHIQGKNLVEVTPPYEFLNGDVYVVDNSDVSPGLQKKVYIWLGSQAFADDRAVGAWAAKQLDFKDKEIDIDTEIEGLESEEFKTLIDFVVVTGDTPGFLKHVEVNAENITYALYRIRDVDLSDGSSSDDIVIENVTLRKDSLISDDVFVLDAWNDLYVWVGSKAQVGEKAAGNRLVRKLDVDRERNPMVYSINEGFEPEGFFDLIDKIANSGNIRTSDASEISKGIVGGIADLKAESNIISPPAELTRPPSSGFPERKEPLPFKKEPEYSAPPPKVTIPQKEIEPTPKDLGLKTTMEAPTQAGNIVKLYYDHEKREFSEVGGKEDAALLIDETNSTAKLIFEEGSSLIMQRTASRQARGICKTGFLLRSGNRIGVNCTLTEFQGERSIDERLLQQGHHYR